MRTGDAWNVRIPLIEQMQAEPVRVQQVVPDSPADKAGIQVGDEIIAAGGTPLSVKQNLAEIVEQYQPGDSLELVIMRGGSQVRILVTVGSNPERSSNQPWLGIYYR
jgi:S1-C subfamily serine protease